MYLASFHWPPKTILHPKIFWYFILRSSFLHLSSLDYAYYFYNYVFGCSLILPMSFIDNSLAQVKTYIHPSANEGTLMNMGMIPREFTRTDNIYTENKSQSKLVHIQLQWHHIWTTWLLQSLEILLLTQQLLQANINRNTKVLNYWPFVRGSQW